LPSFLIQSDLCDVYFDFSDAAKPTVAHKPSASRVSPGLVAATAVGVTAGVLL